MIILTYVFTKDIGDISISPIFCGQNIDMDIDISAKVDIDPPLFGRIFTTKYTTVTFRCRPQISTQVKPKILFEGFPWNFVIKLHTENQSKTWTS